MTSRMLKYDENRIFSNDYMKKQIAGATLCKLVSKRKKLVPRKASKLYMWKYNMKRQNDIFSEPLVHGMCSDLRNTYKAELPRTNKTPQEQAAGLRPNEIPQQQAVGPGPNEISQQQAAGLDLNEIPQEKEAGLVAPQQEEAGLVAPQKEEEEEEEAGLGPNEIPQQQAAGLDLNEIPQEEEEAGLVSPEEEEEAGLDAPQEEGVGPKPELTNEERFGLYFALEVIRLRDGKVDITDKQLVAVMLNTSVRTVERYWNIGMAQKARNEPVDLSNKKNIA